MDSALELSNALMRIATPPRTTASSSIRGMGWVRVSCVLVALFTPLMGILVVFRCWIPLGWLHAGLVLTLTRVGVCWGVPVVTGEQKAAVNMASVLDPPNLLTRLEGPKVADIPQHDHHPVTLSIINRLQKLESGLYEGPAGLEKAQFPDGIDFVHGHRQDGFG